MSSKIVILNGPPGVGKDTLANFLATHYSFNKYRLATPVKRGAHAMLNLVLSDDSFELTKDEELAAFYGRKPRDFYIHVAEKCMKEFFGPQILGHLLVRKMTPDFNEEINIVINGAGFLEELIPIAKAFGGENILVCCLFRNDCTFINDSRSYLAMVPLHKLNINYSRIDLVQGEIIAGQIALTAKLRQYNVL